MAEQDKLAKFKMMVDSSRHLTERHQKLLKEVAAQARERGIHLSADEIDGSWSFRTCVYGNHDVDVEAVIGDLENAPSVIEWRATQKILEQLQSDPDALDHMTGAEKLRFARDHNLEGRAKVDAKMTDEEIAEIRDPSRRVAAYRAKHQQANEEIQQDPSFMSPVMRMAHARKLARGETT